MTVDEVEVTYVETLFVSCFAASRF